MKRITVYADFEQSDVKNLLAACNNYMLDHQEAAEIIEEVHDTIKDWRKIATELQIPHKILTPYCNRWDL